MLVRDFMPKQLFTISPDSTVEEALPIMEENDIRHLPVVDSDEKLVGLVSKGDLLRAIPQGLPFGDELYLRLFEFQKKKIEEVMTADVATVREDAYIEKAASITYENKLSALPVMKDEKVVGILTEIDLFKAFLDIFGVDRPSVRVTLFVPDEVGILLRATQAVSEKGWNITSVIIRQLPEGKAEIMMRLETLDLEAVLDSLKKQQFEVLHADVI